MPNSIMNMTTDTGAAIKVNHPALIGPKVQALLDDPNRLAGLRQRAAALGRPQAAYDVARAALRMAGATV